MLMEVESLSRYYGKYCVVKDLNFQLKKGQVLGFLGINGAGKTTTMQMLTGNLAPSAGKIRINGFDLSQQPRQAKQHLGYLPDVPPLYKELTVKEFLHYCAQLHRIPKKNIKSAVLETQTRCGLTKVTEKLIANLSKGYQQRVGIAQAILHRPECIILDEPTVGLDPVQIKDIRDLIKQLGGEQGVILSSHVLPEIQQVCTDVQIIHQGELVFKETVSALNKRMESASIRLTTGFPLEIDKLMTIEAVTKIESQGENQYLIQHQSETNPLESLTEVIISNGWGLKEIAPQKRSLEDVFMALTDTFEN